MSGCLCTVKACACRKGRQHKMPGNHRREMNGKGKNIFELFKAKETTGVDFNLNWIFLWLIVCFVLFLLTLP